MERSLLVAGGATSGLEGGGLRDCVCGNGGARGRAKARGGTGVEDCEPVEKCGEVDAVSDESVRRSTAFGDLP